MMSFTEMGKTREHGEQTGRQKIYQKLHLRFFNLEMSLRHLGWRYQAGRAECVTPGLRREDQADGKEEETTAGIGERENCCLRELSHFFRRKYFVCVGVAWLAQMEECVTPDLGVMCLSLCCVSIT